MAKHCVPSSHEEAIAQVRSEFQDLKITKEKPWWINVLMRLGFSYLGRYTQAIGTTIYLSSEWDKYSETSKISTILHEREHMRQDRDYGRFWFRILYLFVLFPIGLAYFRAKFEREAMLWNIKVRIRRLGPSEKLKSSLEKHYLKVMTGPKYFYPWPFPKVVRKWFQQDWDLCTRGCRCISRTAS